MLSEHDRLMIALDHLKILRVLARARKEAAEHGSQSRSTFGEVCQAISMIAQSELETLDEKIKHVESQL